MLGPHILGSHFITFFMSADIASQSARRRGSSMVSRYSSTLASVCFVFSSAMEPPGQKRKWLATPDNDWAVCINRQAQVPDLFQYSRSSAVAESQFGGFNL